MRGKEPEPEPSRDGGLRWNGLLLCLGVLAVTFGILFWVHSYVMENTDQAIDAQRMRAIYVALSLYESSNNEAPPPNLAVPMLDRDLNDSDWFRSVNDPWTGGARDAAADPDKPAPAPLDPAFPQGPTNSFRISFTYLPMWVRYGGVKVPDWRKEQLDVHTGLLACYWYGDIDKATQDGHGCTGPVLRINMDGSVRTVERLDKDKLTARDLFGVGR